MEIGVIQQIVGKIQMDGATRHKDGKIADMGNGVIQQIVGKIVDTGNGVIQQIVGKIMADGQIVQEVNNN